jgi:SAM-dependent methyltransferase/uncharacterized protein YbaR (Trm112 family)
VTDQVRDLMDIVACPRDGLPLACEENTLRCSNGHIYSVVDGVPILLVEGVEQTHGAAERSLQAAREGVSPLPNRPEAEIDSYVQEAIASTNGFLYRGLIGHLTEYPIPELRADAGSGWFLDLGCNWGRWCVAAARKGYRPVGIDPNFEAILAARRVATSLGVSADFLVADGRYLPFRAGVFDMAFSYSVIQHFSKDDARKAIGEVDRVLGSSGTALIQMPNKWGIRSLYHLSRRRFGEGVGFDVRYWTISELRDAFGVIRGQAEVEVDGYFGLGIQASDAHLLSGMARLIIAASEFLRKLSSRGCKPLVRFADSVYIRVRHQP